MPNKRCIILGYGNPGRQDDGLGVEFASLVEGDSELMRWCDVESDYQLNIEDALTISGYEVVVFADASIDAKEPFSFERIEPSMEISFTTHTLSAESLLALCHELYRKAPQAYMLAIRGYEWELGLEMSGQARGNLAKAYAFFSGFVSRGFTEPAVITQDDCCGVH